MPAKLVAPRTPALKRTVDVLVGVPAAVLTFPLLALLVAISTVSFRRWGIFSQPRLGRDGHEFWFKKVRTLPATVPPDAGKYDLRDIDIPKFAEFIRARHLDELPQLWHVVSGQMSLVGPRPEMPWLSSTFDSNFVAQRLSVTPGCTGLWQISVASSGLIGAAEEWDRHYVAHATPRLDLWILYRTVLLLVTGDVLESLQQIPRWTGASIRSTR